LGKLCPKVRFQISKLKSSLLNGRFRQPRNGPHNDQAHPPIHPVNHVAAATLAVEDRKVYEFVVRRFLACCSDDAKGQTTTVDLDLAGERFSATGLVVLERNYLDVYPYDKWTSTQPLPQFTQGEMLMPSTLEMVEGKTTSPHYLTEPELIALMDVNGIGTDATMADHIEKIIDRQYVFKQPGGRRAAGEDENNDDEMDLNDEPEPPVRGRGRGRGRGGRGRAARGRGRGGAAGRGGVMEFVPSTLGIGLVEGYDSMQFDVSLIKPFLRKQVFPLRSQLTVLDGTEDEGYI
jgi:DNA topoisomerase III